MNSLVGMFKSERNAFSLGRMCAILSCVAWLFVSVYLALRVSSWDGYTTYTIGTVTYICVQLANKSLVLWGNKIEKNE